MLSVSRCRALHQLHTPEAQMFIQFLAIDQRCHNHGKALCLPNDHWVSMSQRSIGGNCVANVDVAGGIPAVTRD